MKNHKEGEYAAFHRKIMLRFCFNIFISAVLVGAFYLLLWKQRVGDWTVGIIAYCMKIDHEQALYIYHNYFRGYREMFFMAAILMVLVILAWHLFRWMTRYFKEIDCGIDALLVEEAGPICLSEEMLPFERKLNVVRQELANRKEETADANRRKDELVMYLAHDIRTPLTSVIGYLNLLEEEPDMPAEQRAKQVHITLEKAYRLEEMINEFFEINRLNSGQIQLAKEQIDLYYMLVQMGDELSPLLDAHSNALVLDVSENMVICADPDKIVRVFANLIKNAAAYSYPRTTISICAKETDTSVIIYFRNKGKTIPAEKLPLLFDKFYRVDSSRVSDTGGTGLGLAIAKEIVSLHGGSIRAVSEEETITFILQLPLTDYMN